MMRGRTTHLLFLCLTPVTKRCISHTVHTQDKERDIHKSGPMVPWMDIINGKLTPWTRLPMNPEAMPSNAAPGRPQASSSLLLAPNPKPLVGQTGAWAGRLHKVLKPFKFHVLLVR